MSDAQAPQYVDEHITAIEQAKSPAELGRLLRLLVKEVERDTRHGACDVVQKALNEIHNL